MCLYSIHSYNTKPLLFFIDISEMTGEQGITDHIKMHGSKNIVEKTRPYSK